ncbi:flagellar filament capping protein FliD [Lysinibacillus sp. NPDC056232]|uniref:flagellar filament capping protein FliD n=1 Tax=Lysinibacillus sp. NPDC056232 TaxID=3345756 RepID=UPI0035E1390B
MVMRVGGLASGMDIDELVKKLMSAEKAPLNKLYQKKTTYEWQRDAYRSINTKLNTYSNYLFDNFRVSSGMGKKNVSVSDPSKIDVIASSGAAGSLNITGGTAATSARITASDSISTTSKRIVSANDSLQDAMTAVNGTATPSTLTFKLNKVKDGVTEEETITIDTTKSIKDIVADLNSAGLSASFDGAKGQFTFKTKGKDDTITFDDPNTNTALTAYGMDISETSGTFTSKTAWMEPSRLAKGSDTLSEALNIGNSPIDIKLNGKTISIDPTKSINMVINDLKLEGLDASFDTATGKFSFKTKSENDVLDLTNATALTGSGTITERGFTSNTALINGPVQGSKDTRLGELGLTSGSFTISTPSANGETKITNITYSDTDTVDSFMKKLSSAGATAIISSDGKISLSSNATGKGDIELINTDPKLMSKLGLDTAVSQSGSNATLQVNGVDLESATNAFNISGYSVTLKGDIPSGSSISVSSSTDTENIFNKIKEFVDTYNGLIADLNSQVKETKYRDYPPLTDEQKEGMSENEIKLWEEKAKSGLLRSDSIIRDGLANMRMSFLGNVAGLDDSTIDALSELGITTSSSVSDGGKLVINEEKLRAAIEKDSDQVVSLFTQTGSVSKDADGKTVDSRGIAQRLKAAVDSTMKGIETKAGKATHTDNQYSLGKNLIDTNKRIDVWKAKLEMIEKRYWKQFTAMEQAINKANSQSGYLSQFGGQG